MMRVKERGSMSMITMFRHVYSIGSVGRPRVNASALTRDV